MQPVGALVLVLTQAKGHFDQHFDAFITDGEAARIGLDFNRPTVRRLDAGNFEGRGLVLALGWHTCGKQADCDRGENCRGGRTLPYENKAVRSAEGHELTSRRETSPHRIWIAARNFVVRRWSADREGTRPVVAHAEWLFCHRSAGR